MINPNRVCELLDKHENAFHELFWCDDDLTDLQHKNLCQINTQEKIMDFIQKCVTDMINVDKITKEKWLSGGL